MSTHAFIPVADEPRTFDEVAEARSFYRWSCQFSAALVHLRRRFAGDLDLCLLYMVFVQGEMARGLAATEAAAKGRLAPPPRGLNALSVAEICGVPRETTRRKLHALTEKGLLSQGADGLLYLAGEAPIEVTTPLISLASRGVRV